MIKKCILVVTQSTRYSSLILITLEFSRSIFEKLSNIKFQENPSSGSRVVPCGQMDRQTKGWTAMTKLMVAFRNFENVPRNDT
jgi:hypothetical protein